MLQNFFTIWMRKLQREKFYSMLNILGLCIGLTSVIILFVFVYNELTYDKFHKDYARIYRLTTTFNNDGYETRYALNEGIWDNYLESQVSGVESSTAFMPVYDELLFSVGEKFFSQGKGLHTDEDFLKVFDFPMLSGSREMGLKDLNSIVITRNVAEKLFGSIDVLGKSLEQKTEDGSVNLVVTGVMENIPANSSIKFDFLMRGSAPWWNDQFTEGKRFGNTLHIFFKTHDKEDISVLQQKIDKAFSIKNDPDKKFIYKTPVQKLSDLYLHADREFELVAGGNMNYIRLFFIVGCGLLFITIVNYVNLSTARSVKRAKEVGIRKSLGTSKHKLILQFLTESILVSLGATVFASLLGHWVISNFVGPFFSINTGIITDVYFILILLLTGIIIGILAGIYPAAKMASYTITEALKGKIKTERTNLFGLRNSLVLIQIMTTVTLLALSIITFRQIDYLQNKPLGYNKNNVIYFIKPDAISYSRWSEFQEKLKSQSAFVSVGGSSAPLLGSMSKAQVKSISNNLSITASWNAVDNDFTETLRMEMIEGRDFSREFISDSSAIIINETAMKAFGLDNPIGKKLSWWKGKFEIVGVVRDFHYQSFNSAILPAIFILDRNPSKFTFARTEPLSVTEILKTANTSWTAVNIEAPFEYKFLDETFDRLIQNEIRTSEIITVFTFISMMITGIGLIGLIGYVAEQYRKQISIRKVLGATTNNILFLLSNNFGILFCVAIVLSIPIILQATNFWLSDFEYKIALNYSDFFISWSLIAVFILLVISWQAISSARENPVKVLKEE